MASITTWLVRLGNAGAVRNAAADRAERRVAEMQADALMRRFEATSPQVVQRRLTTSSPAA